MGDLSDYEGLKTAIAREVDRDDLTSRIPMFIELAEDDMSDLSHPYFTERIVFTADNQVSVPIGFRSVISMGVPVWGAIRWVSQENFDNVELWPANCVGVYTIIGEYFYFSDTLVGSDVTLTFRRRIDALSIYNPTNWILRNYPSAYLYGALKHAAVYMVEDERIPLWDSLYQGILDRINRNGLEFAAPEFMHLNKSKVV